MCSNASPREASKSPGVARNRAARAREWPVTLWPGRADLGPTVEPLSCTRVSRPQSNVGICLAGSHFHAGVFPSIHWRIRSDLQHGQDSHSCARVSGPQSLRGLRRRRYSRIGGNSTFAAIVNWLERFVNGIDIPMWVSVNALVVAGGLAVGLWREGACSERRPRNGGRSGYMPGTGCKNSGPQATEKTHVCPIW